MLLTVVSCLCVLRHSRMSRLKIIPRAKFNSSYNKTRSTSYVLAKPTSWRITFKYRNTILITPINRSRCLPQKKQQAPSQTTISFKPISTIPIKEPYPTETEMKTANWPVIRSKRFPHWRKPYHVRRKSTGWTLASTLAYGINCIPIADQIYNKKKEKCGKFGANYRPKFSYSWTLCGAWFVLHRDIQSQDALWHGHSSGYINRHHMPLNRHVALNVNYAI